VLQEELDPGLLLPGNVVVYEKDSGSAVAAIDAKKMPPVAENPKLENALLNRPMKSYDGLSKGVVKESPLPVRSSTTRS